MSYSPRPYEVALRDWLVRALGAGVAVVYANQTGSPRPPRPFVSLQVVSLTPQGTPGNVLTDEAAPVDPEEVDPPPRWVGRLRHNYLGRCDVNVFGDNHRELAELIQTSLWLPEEIEAAEADDHTSVASVAALADGPVVAGAAWDNRTTLEVVFSHASDRPYYSTAIETVAATPEVS